jgi:hypothetical protein
MRIIAALFFGLIPSLSFGQDRVDIVKIFQNFVASSVAANACNAVDKSTVVKFGANNVTVATRATMALKERNPAMSEKELGEKIVKMLDGIKQSVKNEIDQSGCGSDRIQQLLKLYEMHAKLDLH